MLGKNLEFCVFVDLADSRGSSIQVCRQYSELKNTASKIGCKTPNMKKETYYRIN